MAMRKINRKHVLALMIAALLTAIQSVSGDDAIVRSGTLLVRVDSLASNDGQLRFVLFDTKKTFLKRPLRAEAFEIVDYKGSWIVDDLPFGTYAVLVHHDVNGNGKMERHWYGKPKEPSGVSNDPPPRMGPPKFDAAKFEFKEDQQTIVIAVK